MSRITAADLSYPVLTRKVGGGLRDLLDGAHRVAKSKQTGQPVHEIVVSRGLLRKAEVNETNKEIEGKQYASVGGRMIDVEKLWKLTKGMPSKPLDVSKIQWRLEKKASDVLYHGSPKKLKILAPKNIHGDPDVANAVFATPSREFALPYAGGKWGDRDINQNTQFKKGVRRTIVQEMRPGAFRDIFDGKKGYMYEVPKETFRAPRGRTTWEVISEEKVKPIKVEEIKDVGAALRQAGVTMLPYDPRETLKVLKRRDKRTALMSPDKQRGYYKWWMEKAPPEVMSALKERMKALDKKAALIGHISGISGSGKTTLAREIGALYPHLVVKDTDEFLDYAKARYPDMTTDDKVEHVNRLAKAFLRKHKDSPVLLAGGQTKKMDEIVDADKRWMINTGPGLSTWRKYRRLNERPWVGPIGERTESIWDIPKNYTQGWRKRSKIIGRGYQSMSADEIRQRVKDVLEKTAFLGFENLPGRSGYEKHLRANLDVGKKWLREGKTTKGKLISLMHVLHGIVPHKLTSHETYRIGIEKKASFARSFLVAFIDELEKITGS